MIGRQVLARRVPGLACRAALVPAAALVVHQLRFALAFGGLSGAQLARTGHSYLHSLTPWMVLAVATAFGGFLGALGRALAGQRWVPRYTLSLAALWLACTVCLVAIYAGQESLEGLLIAGHPAGLAGVFGYGGWWAIPSAAAVGLVLATALHGARWALDAAARLAESRAGTPRHAGVGRPRLRPVASLRAIPLAGGWSDRGPPRRAL
jgi:hypothetical protein